MKGYGTFRVSKKLHTSSDSESKLSLLSLEPSTLPLLSTMVLISPSELPSFLILVIPWHVFDCWHDEVGDRYADELDNNLLFDFDMHLGLHVDKFWSEVLPFDSVAVERIEILSGALYVIVNECVR